MLGSFCLFKNVEFFRHLLCNNTCSETINKGVLGKNRDHLFRNACSFEVLVINIKLDDDMIVAKFIT